MMPVVQDIALDTNGRWIKCVPNVKFIVFHMNFRKYLNFRTSENFWTSENFQKIFFVQICFLQRIFFWQKSFLTIIFSKNFSLLSVLGKIVRKKSEWPFLAILNLYQFFWGKLSEKIQNGQFWPFQICTSLFGKSCWKKFRMAILGHSKFILVYFGKKLLEKIQNGHFWPFQICTSLFQENCQKKFRMAIFGHSKFVPVFLGKVVRKYLEQSFLAILIFSWQFFCTYHFNRV